MGVVRKSATALGVLFFGGLLILLAILLLWYLLAGRVPGPPGPPPEPEPPKAQPATCADVQFIVIPGTWESMSNDDPRNPHLMPLSLMLGVSRPARNALPPQRVDVVTIPYVAQFSNPIAFPPDGQRSYNLSRGEGFQRAFDEMANMHKACPLSTFVLAGFSQGAVIAGDLAEQIGANKGPVPERLVLGVTLIADGRRQPGELRSIGPEPPGVGAEIALAGVRVPGITMTGPREGYGKLRDRMNTMCRPGDLICDAPKQAMNPFNVVGNVGVLLQSAGNPVHAQYAQYMVEPGVSATQWTARWAINTINAAPHPPHS